MKQYRATFKDTHNGQEFTFALFYQATSLDHARSQAHVEVFLTSAKVTSVKVA